MKILLIISLFSIIIVLLYYFNTSQERNNTNLHIEGPNFGDNVVVVKGPGFIEGKLGNEDIEKIYVIENEEASSDFGKYHILLTISDDTYLFNTFDIENGKPIPKNFVSHFKNLNYIEAQLSAQLVTTAIKACEKEGINIHEAI